MDDSPKVFISYSQDSMMHKEKVRNLSNKLNDDGVDCYIDQYETSPPEGWPKWMHNNIKSADYVLVVCSEIYCRRVEGKEEPGKGLGASWEGTIITQSIYEEQGQNTKFIPIIFGNNEIKNIPDFLKPVTYYDMTSEDGYENLYRHLTQQPRAVKPPLGKIKILNNSSNESPNKPGNNINQKREDTTLVLFYIDSKITIIPALEIKYDQELNIILNPQTASDASFISSLKNSSKTLSLAFGNYAFLVDVKSIIQRLVPINETWILTLIPREIDNGIYMEASVGNMSADDIAMLRAKRILLNETLDSIEQFKYDGHNRDFVDIFIKGNNNHISITKSPFPDLYTQFKDDISYYLSAAHLIGVLFLKMSGVVEHIYRLDLAMINNNEMRVDFVGIRHKKYSNEDPFRISVSGICHL